MTGLRQEDFLSPILFNIVLEKVIRVIHVEDNGKRLGDLIGLLTYEIDLVLLIESKEYLIEQVEQLLDTAKRVCLEINVENTEYMVVWRGEVTHTQI